MKLSRYAKLALIAAPALVATTAFATGGTNAAADDFDSLVNLITGWLEGTLGKTIALASLAVGLGMGIIQQSIMAVVVGIGTAVAVSFGPGVLTSLFPAGLGF